ncbi:hypothetical protein [Foetidibacter luteolus]|uniref:hypothetical protein n=1 Tax=Foetidibacter luteolus TaxID=2608880 RepID=UPI00129BE9D5|nr:hypothetical protein [Foetidibacter luteolus]
MKNALAWLILLLYVLLIALLWFNSKNPSFKDIPVLYLAGLGLALLNVFIGRKKQYGKPFGLLNLAFFVLCLVHLFAVYGLLKTIFKG